MFESELTWLVPRRPALVGDDYWIGHLVESQHTDLCSLAFRWTISDQTHRVGLHPGQEINRVGAQSNVWLMSAVGSDGPGQHLWVEGSIQHLEGLANGGAAKTGLEELPRKSGYAVNFELVCCPTPDGFEATSDIVPF
jgi:hypothetical protein